MQQAVRYTAGEGNITKARRQVEFLRDKGSVTVSFAKSILVAASGGLNGD